jgi:hypothetical protein
MSVPSAHFTHFPHWPIDQWRPHFPAGDIRRIYLHWSGGDYELVYPAYHYCIAWHEGVAFVVQTNELRANMRDVYADDAPYAAHTYRRNSYAAGLSIMGMRDARPDDFGSYPLLDAGVDALCRVAAGLLQAYGLDVDPDRVGTHAEAAIEDGYFGVGGEDVRWDIARLAPSDHSLTEEDARVTGAILRERIQAYI